MRLRLPLAFLLALASAVASAQAPAPAPAPATKPAPAAKPDDLPKAAPRGEEPADTSKLPAFMGIFGPAELIAKTGFRSQPGRYVEYRLTAKESGGATTGTMRIQEVGPAVRGGRWIEVIATPPDVGAAALRMLVKGEKDGNLERLIAKGPDMPPLEFPMNSVTLDSLQGMGPGTGTSTLMGNLRNAGKESITVPLGKFETTHWVIESPKMRMDFWTTVDPKVPFTGAIRMVTPEGEAEAVKLGSDAVAVVPVPVKAK